MKKREYKNKLYGFLNKDVKDTNKVMLSFGLAFCVFLIGFLSYVIGTSYAYYVSKVEGKVLIEMTYSLPNVDTSSANNPKLSSNMIPVYYDSSSKSWKKADASNGDTNYKWYDYDNKMWANAVTVTSSNRGKYLEADVGTEISMSDINSMWVWIPRYTYTYFNSSSPKEISIKFEEGTGSSGTIKCTEASDGESSTSEVCEDKTNNGLVADTSTYTHPAFWWDKNDDGVRDENEELTGIWVGKFDASSDKECTPASGASIGTGCDLETIRPKIIPNVNSWRGAQVSIFFNGMYKMRESGNQYGFNVSDETHMMKNMEWGAVTYLAYSKYGRCTSGKCTEITINNCNKHVTGIGADSVSATTSSTTCTTSANKYDGAKGVLASTTGNIYGVYDMSGGSWDYVMGDMVYSDGTMMSGRTMENNYNSNFTGHLYVDGAYTGAYDFPSRKYYDKYSYGTSDTGATRSKLGDAIKEMGLSGSSTSSWYSDGIRFSIGSDSWFVRSGYYGHTGGAGAFYLSSASGDSSDSYSARASLALPNK